MTKTTIWATLSILVCFGWSNLHAQATRLALAEEFTNASCGPCASQNPGFNSLLQQNPTKIIDIKYQWDFPGFDPMNQQNPGEVDNRIAYYGFTGVPTGVVDGTPIANDCNGYVGAPACLSQSEIDAAANVSTPIALTVTHSLSSDLTSATVDVTVTNVGSSTFTPNGNLYLRLALVESEIIFPTAPGSNGEKDFYGVMRKMIPNALGTALPASFTAGQVWSNQFTVSIPSYIYNYGEIAFVAFVQSDGDKQVHNAAHSPKQTVPAGFADAAVGNVSSAGGLCDASFTPAVTITNNSSGMISSADVSYSLNGSAPVTQSWTGSLGQGATATVTFPTTTLSGGSNQFTASVSNVNGQVDINTLNNTVVDVYSVISPNPQSTPYEKGFENNSLGDVPSEFVVEDQSGRVFVVDQGISSSVNYPLGGFGGSNKSFRMDFATIDPGSTPFFIMEKVDLSGVAGTPLLSFDHGYAERSGVPSSDALEVFVSGDCGVNWTSVWQASGAQLATASPTASNMRIYPRANEWARQVIDLSAFASSNEVVFRFQGTSGGNNALYIDNIFVSNTTIGEEELEIADLSIYPVPAQDRLNVQLNGSQGDVFEVQLIDQLGAVVGSYEFTASEGSNLFEIGLNDLANGLYSLDIRSNRLHSIRKFTVVR